ncbi:MAG: VIT domain-containing protein [Kofleriaceae bacterium]
MAAAGADHAPGDDLAARVLAAIDAEAAAPAPAPAPTAPTAATPPRRGRTLGLGLGLAGLGALAATTALVVRSGDDAATPRASVAASTSGVAGEVARIERSGPGVGGLTLAHAGGWQPAAAGATVALGGAARTDERTRAWLTLADGSRVVLDADSELALGVDGWRLVRGRVVADVAARARIATARGVLDVAGARLMVTAGADDVLVRVARGSVALGTTEVRAGEEATLLATGAPRVVAVPAASRELAWAEREVDDEPAPSGLGSLRAYKPGESRDRDWPLALAEHAVAVRIAGPLARTEITETFRNDSSETLEGVFQFPLPPDAKIDDLALDVEGGFEHGAFVESARADKIWKGVIDKAAPKQLRRGPIWSPSR